jgi:hypothetical protein
MWFAVSVYAPRNTPWNTPRLEIYTLPARARVKSPANYNAAVSK